MGSDPRLPDFSGCKVSGLQYGVTTPFDRRLDYFVMTISHENFSLINCYKEEGAYREGHDL